MANGLKGGRKGREEATMVVPTSCDGGSAQGTGGDTGTISVELTGLRGGLEVGMKERQKSRKTPGLGRPGLFLSLR